MANTNKKTKAQTLISIANFLEENNAPAYMVEFANNEYNALVRKQTLSAEKRKAKTAAKNDDLDTRLISVLEGRQEPMTIPELLQLLDPEGEANLTSAKIASRLNKIEGINKSKAKYEGRTLTAYVLR